VRAGGDVDQVVLALRVEGVGTSELVQRAVDLLEVPGVAKVDGVETDLGLRRHGAQVGGDGSRERRMRGRVEELEAVDEEALLLAEADTRAPAVPAPGTRARVQDRTQEPEYDRRLHYRIGSYFIRMTRDKPGRGQEDGGAKWHAPCSPGPP